MAINCGQAGEEGFFLMAPRASEQVILPSVEVMYV